MPTPLYSIRLNLALKARLTEIAESRGRTLSSIIDRALTEFADNVQGQRQPALHLYVFSRSDGKIKIGMTKNVNMRRVQFMKEPRNKDVHFTLEWMSPPIENAPRIEKQWKFALGGNHRGKGSGETFDIPAHEAIRVVQGIINEIIPPS